MVVFQAQRGKDSPLKFLVLERYRKKDRGDSFGNNTDKDEKAKNLLSEEQKG